MDQSQGHRWSLEEEEQLRKTYLSGVAISHLAQHHARSRQAIRKRLVRLGLLEPENNLTNTISGTWGAGRIESVCAWSYLLLSERGEVYLGATTHLRHRLRDHNSSGTRSTRGRKWHLLAVRPFFD